MKERLETSEGDTFVTEKGVKGDLDDLIHRYQKESGASVEGDNNNEEGEKGGDRSGSDGIEEETDTEDVSPDVPKKRRRMNA